MKTREKNRNNKQTEIERFDWVIKRLKTRVAFGWLSERSGELSRNQLILRFDVILQHNWPIEQSVLHIRVFFGEKTRKPCFALFIHWLIKQIRNTYREYFLWSYENRSIAFWMLLFLLCRQVKDKSKKLWKAWWTPRTDLPLRKAACKLVSRLFI